MKSIDKFNWLLELESKERKIQITTIQGNKYYCKPHSPAEDEDDWAYVFYTPDYPSHYFILNCNFISEISEITDEDWLRHLKEIENKK